MVTIVSIGETYTTKKGTKRTLVTYQGTQLNLITGSYNKANGFVAAEIAVNLQTGMQLDGNITRVTCSPFAWVNKDGVVTVSTATNVLGNDGEPYQVLVDRANANNAFQMNAKGLSVPSAGIIAAAPVVVVPSAGELQLAELKAKTSLTKAEKAEYAALLID